MPFPLCSSSEDRVVWASSPTSSFDSKSAYSIAADISNCNPPFTGSWIWKLDTLPRIQYFLWKCHFHSIPTKDVLERRGFMGDLQCQVFNTKLESIIHVLRDCPFAKCFWENIQAASLIPNFYNMDLCSWLKVNCECGIVWVEPGPWKTFFPFTVWRLRLHRKKIVFKSSHPNHDLLKEVQATTFEFFFCVARSIIGKRKHSINVRWSKPDPGWYKFNTDGSSLSNLGMVGGGGLIWDDSGNWVKGFTRSIGVTTRLNYWL